MSISVRFPESLRDRVREHAERDRRSMNSEILALLEEALAAREQARTLRISTDRPVSYDA